MENVLPKVVPDADPWRNVPVLIPADDPRLDPAPIARLFAERGERGAEHVIGRAMDEIAERVAVAEAQHAACNFGDLARTARSIVGVANEIGFRGVARAASSVSQCAAERDAVALSATVARLSRLADQSLSSVWDIDRGNPPSAR